jgi:hypothetical protein
MTTSPTPNAPDRRGPTTAAGAPPARRKRLWPLLAGLLTLGALAWMIPTVADGAGRGARQVRRTYAGPIRTVEVDATHGSVVLTRARGHTVVVVTDIEGWVERGGVDAVPRERLEGDRLVVSSSCPPTRTPACRADHRVEVPDGVAVVARSGAGGIEASGVTGALWLRASGGGVEVRGAAGRLHLDATGGGVVATDTTSDAVEARASGGGVSLSFGRPPSEVDAVSSGGGVVLRLPTVGVSYRIEATASGGTARSEVASDPGSARIVGAHASGGGVLVAATEP